MTDESDFERVIDSIASGEPVDWTTARRHANSEDDRARIEALQDIAKIAAFSHAQWQQFSPLLEHALDMDAAVLEPWLQELDPADAADLRRTLDPRKARAGEASPASSELPGGSESIAGQIVGAYTLESPIGEGGMGTVWLARRSDGRFEGRVAIKLLHLPRVDRDGLARFQREGHILARLQHSNVAQLMDAGVAPGGQPYLVLEYVDGVSIDRYCDAHQLDIRGRIELFLGVLEAVAYAHTKLVLHRDLKPSNILVDHMGRVKLLDFGIAKLLEDEGGSASETELTQRAGHAFTPEFAAPEQLLGNPVTTATDVYAAGVVLYALLTGSHPTPGVHRSPAERIQAILDSSPKPASESAASPAPASRPDGRTARDRRELQGDLDNILAKALKKTPEERYANAAAFADDLRRYLNLEPVAARADTITYRVGKFVRRHRGAVASATLAVLALLGLTFVAISQLFEARRQRDEARTQTQRAEAFNSVVTSLLSQTGPGGRALSPEEMLDQAVEEMEARYADDPAFLVDMLIRISGRYFDLRNSKKEHATLVKAEAIARRAADPLLIFNVQVNTVETELALGHKSEAQQRMEEARALLPRLDPAPILHNYYRAEAEVAGANNDLPASTGHLENARRALEAEDRTHGNSYVGILSLLRRNYTLLGNVLQAHEYAVAWADIEKRHHREKNVSGITSRGVLATSFYSLGEVTRAQALFEEALPEFKVAATTDSIAPSNTLAFNYGEILSRLGRHEPAIKLIHGAIDAADKGGNQTLRTRSRLTLARSLLRAGRIPETQQALDEVVTMMMEAEAANHVALVEATRLRSEAFLAEQRLDEAMQEANAALQRLGYPQTRRGGGLPRAVLTLANVQLAQGQPAASLGSARVAVELFEKDTIDPSRSADVGEALLAVARAQLALDDPSAARKSRARATQALRNGLGPDHGLVGQSEQRAVRLR